jgi:hypothetical protein
MTNIIAVIQIVAALTAAVLVSIYLISATRIQVKEHSASHTNRSSRNLFGDAIPVIEPRLGPRDWK